MLTGFLEAHTDAWAHLGGLITGVAYGFLNLKANSLGDEISLRKYNK